MMKWNGEDYRNSVELSSDEDPTNLYPKFDSHFGHGIVTISVPFMLRTPPGVNLMTINPPNYLLPGITVMTGVVETDNLRNNFTFNLKLNIPGLNIMIPKGTPLAAFIPVPRYYVDNFSLQLAENQFEENDIVEELNAAYDFDLLRSEVEPEMKNHVNRKYLLGTDIYDNKFNDHQGP